MIFRISILLGTFMLLAFANFSYGITVMSLDMGSEWIKIAIVKPGVPMEIVLNKESKRKTEAAVSLRDGEREFGSAAVSKGVRFPPTTYFYLQDLLAKKLNHPLVQQFKTRFPYYKLEEDPETGYVVFRHDEETTYSPEELLAMIFNNSKSLAETYAEQKIDTCVLTVPAYFNQAERRSVLYAAKMAGLKVSQLMDDNTAAALNYGVFRRKDMNTTAQYIMLYDMGASSTVASIISYQIVKANGVTDPQLSVQGIGYDRTLGGSSIEFLMREKLIEKFNENKKTKMDVRESPRAMAKLLKEARRVKQVLSANMDHFAQIEGLIDDEDFRAKVTRQELEEVCSDLWEKVSLPMKQALKSASLSWNEISKVILVGGGVRVPKVQEIILKESGKPDLGKMLNNDEAPALGASYQAAAHSNGFRVKTFNVRAAATYPIQIDFDRTITKDDGSSGIKHVRKTLFHRNNPYPQKKVITFSRFYDNFNFTINYGDISFMTSDQLRLFGVQNLTTVSVTKVKAAYEEQGSKNGSEYKGVKVHFRMDESGILNLENSEAIFEVNKVEEVDVTGNESTDESSTFQKIKDGISSLFGGSDDAQENTEKSEETAEKTKENKEEKGKPDDDSQFDQNKDHPEENQSKEETETQENKDEKTEDETSKEDKTKEKEDSTEKDTEKLEDNKEGENKTEEEIKEKHKKKKTVKKVNHVIRLSAIENSLDFVNRSTEMMNLSLDKLKKLAERDQFKVDREKAMNNLEAYIYDKQDKLYQKVYEDALTDEEKETITTSLREASDWMFELEGEPEPKVYKDRLSEIRKLTKPWLQRVKERLELPEILKDMEQMLNYTVHLLSAITSLKEEEQIYTETEIKLLANMLNQTMTWKNDTLKEQNALHPSKDNIMKPDSVKMKIGELNREVQYLLNKAKTAKPKKPVEDKKKNSTETVHEKQKSTNSTVIDDDQNDEHKNINNEDSTNKEKDNNIEAGENKETETKDSVKEDYQEGDGGGEEDTLELPPPDADTTTTTTGSTTQESKDQSSHQDEL